MTRGTAVRTRPAQPAAAQRAPGAPSDAPGRPSRTADRLAYLAAGSAAVAAAWTFSAPGLLNGPDVMNGSARGTSLVVLVVAVPALLAGVRWSARGSARALVVRAGATAYLLYNALLLLFMTPFNAAFLAYVVMLSSALWSLVALWASVDVDALGARFSGRAPVRAVAVYVWVVAVLNAAAWLRMVVPGLGADGSPDFLVGTGTTTNTVYVQDLAVWLPLAGVAALWLWRRQPRGLVVVSALLTLWVVEALSIAVDQWFGHRADPGSDVASDAVVTPFLLLAVVGLVPLLALLRRFDEAAPAPVRVPPAGRRTTLAALSALMSVAALAGAVGLVTGLADFGPEIDARLPFGSLLLAGAALLVVVAAPTGTAAGLAWRGGPGAPRAAVVAGLLLVGWIVVEVAVIRSFSLMQPACLGYGLLLTGLGLRAAHPRPRSPAEDHAARTDTNHTEEQPCAPH